ncbi:Ycf48-like protein precursor [Polystyrenella longa]|uniref:Ycf48-like protein n=1 Tax=Polystyrenella longa TaxID=2528007 RepID=A0A518CIL3_9PLAN|nr:YCF48-related protein [Polystyrenella longa]QDU79069.1 Ycf48-like protein precursor [Polystyrenella longa]
MTYRPIILLVCLLTLGCFCAGTTCSTSRADEPALLPQNEDAQPLTPGAAVIPIQEDAHFRDVCLIDAEVGFAVGDQGAIWKTTDGGESWKWQPTGFAFSLTDVCFLTRKVGWIAARGVHPYGQEGWGLILHTRDGGATWNRLPQNQLPPLNSVQFFDLENGVAIGEASPQYPSGVMVTSDGGQTWIARPGESDKNWLAGHFANIQEGVVTGALGQIAQATPDQFSPVTFSQFDLRALRDVHYSRSGACWIAGEGGSLFYSKNQGTSWSEPPSKLPDPLALMQDFQSVTQAGSHVWVAGSPGSVIWHSPDEGQTWEPQYTGQTVPIEKITFNSDSHGCAVGALGTILLTQDGGRTWRNVKGGDRHVALMQVAIDRENIDVPLLAQQSAEQGYRSFVYLPVRDDVPQSHYRGSASGPLLSNSSVLAVHGSHSVTAWQFPLVSPDLEYDRMGLIEELNRWSDGNLGPVMLEAFVCQLRTWRPEVLVLPQADTKNEINKLFQQAFHEAIAAAADPTRFLKQQELLGLKPWQVKRVFYQAADGRVGDVEVDPYDLLARKSQTIIEFAASGLHQTGRGNLDSISPVHYQFVPPTDPNIRQPSSSFFGGIVLAPGGAARRQLEPLNEEALEKAKKLAQRRKHLTAISEYSLDEQGHSGQMLSELHQSLRGFTPRQASEHLAQLARQYREQGYAELEELVLVELINLYPHESITSHAVTRLYHIWSSTELAWIRSRESVVQQETGRLNRQAQGDLIRQAEALRGQRSADAPPLLLKGEQDPFEQTQREGDFKVGPQKDWRNARVKLWRTQAVQLAEYFQTADEYQFHTPAIQFPLAGLIRELEPADRRQFASAEANDPVALFQLIGANSRPSVASKKTKTPPHLDGLLSDPCWEKAGEIRLSSERSQPTGTDNRPILFLAHDDKFLYVAGSFPKLDIPYAETITAGRQHDEAAAGFDRLQMVIDLDADYHSAYEFTFDQRGQISESCVGDSRWDPQLYLAVVQDETHWRLEGAIPMEELCPHAPEPGQRWAVCLQRIVPSVAVQGWALPTGQEVTPSSFGTVMFEE